MNTHTIIIPRKIRATIPQYLLYLLPHSLMVAILLHNQTYCYLEVVRMLIAIITMVIKVREDLVPKRKLTAAKST